MIGVDGISYTALHLPNPELVYLVRCWSFLTVGSYEIQGVSPI